MIMIRIILTMVIFNLMSPSRAQDEFKIGVDHYPPWVIVEGKKIHGIDIDLSTLMAKKLNLKVKLISCPWKRCLFMMKNGQLDILGSVALIKDRQEYMHYLKPSYEHSYRKVFYARPGMGKNITKYEDLKPFKIGTRRGEGHFEKFDNDTSLKKLEVDKFIHAVKMVINKRIDMAVSTERPGDWMIKKANLSGKVEKAVFHYKDPGDDGGYITISKKSAHVGRLEEIKKVYKEIIDSGELKKIEKSYQ